MRNSRTAAVYVAAYQGSDADSSRGGKEEAKHLVKARGPGVFLVSGTGDAEIAEIDVFLPAADLQPVMEEVGVAQVAQAFGGTHVQPYARSGPGASIANEVEDAALIPPDAGREDGELAEDLRVGEAEGEGDEAAERGASESGVGGVGEGAEGAVHQRLELFDEELSVAVAGSAAETRVSCGGVLGHATNPGVVDADEDDGLDLTGFCEGIGGRVGAPGVVGDVGRATVHQVLAVVEIKDGEASGGVVEIHCRKVNNDISLTGQKAGGEALKLQKTGVIVQVAGGTFAGSEWLEAAFGTGCRAG
jgi:hypothetical protein